MTVFEASSKLFEWFAKNDYFDIEEHFIPLVMISEEEGPDRAAVLGALNELIKMELIVYQQVEDKTYYILKKNLDAFDQSLSVDHQTAKILADTINAFCDRVGDKTDYCDVKDVSVKDLRNIIFICRHFMDSGNKAECDGDLDGFPEI